MNEIVVDTTAGPVRGRSSAHSGHDVTSWKGIRFAAAPVGELRFQIPQPAEPHREVFDASAFGPACPQPKLANMPLELGAAPGDDCLRLNIWAPSDTSTAKPVMVWLHGGAYVLGSGSQPLYNGRRLAGGGDVVIVTINYRLGALGFLDLSSFSSNKCRFDSNLGLHDVLAALRWVRDNIAGFGGDPGQVTVFGDSAGAGLVTTLLAMPSAAGLFHRAIAQSSPATSVYDKDRGAQLAGFMLDRMGVDPSDAHRLLEVPTQEIVAASKHAFNDVPVRNPGTLAFVPIVDGDLLPDYPVKLAQQGHTLPIPLIIGTNRNEAALFRLMRSPLMPITPHAITSMFTQIAAEQPDLQLPTREQLHTAYAGLRSAGRALGIATDVGFRMPTVWLAEGHSAVAPVHLYRFDYCTPLFKLLLVRAAHATELPYVWGTLGSAGDPSLKLGGAKTAKEVSVRMRTRWVNFAAHGRPDGPAGSPEWPSYCQAARACLVIGAEDSVTHDSDAPIRAAWGNRVVGFR